MKIKNVKKGFVIDLSMKVIDETCVNELRDYFISVKRNKRIGLNLENAEVKGNSFFDLIEEFSEKIDISIFNVNSELFLLFNIMKYDKEVQFFAGERDFMLNRRVMVHRNFKICA